MLHILPVNLTPDDPETIFTTESGHVFETTCSCNPRVEINDEILVVHEAFDDRMRSVENAIQEGRVWAGFRGTGTELIEVICLGGGSQS